MKLLKIALRNFKGVQSFELDTQEGDVNIYGDNATGKTTINDAITWLLFDKDSQFKSQFEIKTLEPSGEPVHGLEHEVAASFLLDDGTIIDLRKTYKEKWTKKRGSATSDFTGHTTNYHINGVPEKKGDFVCKVQEIADEEIFKLLTSPSYFPEKMKWQDRRDLLLKIGGDVTPAEIIKTNRILADLPGILGSRSIDDHKKTLAKRKSTINDELKTIPARIDEANRALPDKTFNVPKEEENKRVVEEAISEKAHLINEIRNGGKLAERRKALAEAETKVIEVKNRALSSDTSSEKRKKLSELRQSESKVEHLVHTAAKNIEKLEYQAYDLNVSMDRLRDEFSEHFKLTFTPPEQNTEALCPTCGQTLPLQDLAELEKVFNINKANELEHIQAEGKALKAKKEELLASMAPQRQILEQHTAERDKLAAEIKTLQGEVEKDTPAADSYKNMPEYREAIDLCEHIKHEINTLQEEAQTIEAGHREGLETLHTELGIISTRIQMVKSREAGEARIAELKNQERELAAEYERLERELYLIEEFIRAKVNLLEEKINSKFKFAKFKLFQEQINGGLTECCEVVYDGVPYSSGLNNGARINVGLDIINTLSKHYNISLPVFIDNAESVTQLINVESQVIRLIVSPKDTVLRVERDVETPPREAA